MEGRNVSHFRVAAKIGGGGMGVVYRAEDLRLGRPVALKFLPPAAVSDPERRQRFLREARTEAALSHPGIAAVYEVDEADGAVFIAMEFVEGKTLRQAVGGHPLPLADALKIASEMAEALAFAHEARVVHRDLKPDNVMIRTDGHVKVLDFGLAKLLKEPLQASLSDLSQAATASVDLTAEMKVMGTPAYMSPEQARGEKADPRADMFAFGVILYEMLTGKNPFRRDGYPATLEAIKHAEAPPLMSATPAGRAAEAEPAAMLEDLERIVGRCLEKDRDRRYDSMAQVREEIEAVRSKLTASRTGEREAIREGKPRRVPALVAAGTAVAVAVLVAAVAWQPLRDRLFGAPAGGKIESIAVLPFENLSNDPNQEFLVDGITDALITDLSKIRALKVISRTSILQYKDVRKPLPEIGRELNVDVILAGTVMRSGERVRVNAQLVHASTDRNLWSDGYELDLESILSLQSDLARTVAREIEIEVTPREREHLHNPSELSPEAAELYLKGRYWLTQWDPKDRPKAVDLLRQAARLEPESALVHAALSQAWYGVAGNQFSADEAYAEARAAAERAIALDDDLAEAYVPLALVRLFGDWDWEGAEVEFRRAVELNRSFADAYMWYGVQKIFEGRLGRARDLLGRAVELDPLSQSTALTAVWPDYFGRDFERAIDGARRVISMDESFVSAHVLLGWSQLAAGEPVQGVATLERAVEIDPHPEFKAYLCHAYAQSGDTGKARSLLEELLEIGEKRNLEPTLLVPVYAALGEHDLALQWLERAVERHAVEVLWVNMDPRFDVLRDDPRFQEIIGRVGFPA